MQSQKPPAVATWLLEHLTPGIKDGALAGDLLEEFAVRHSAAWYWRQVILAIFAGLAKELRLLWVAAAAALLWACAIFNFSHTLRAIISSSLFLAIEGWGVRLNYPFSTIFGIAAFSLLYAAPLLIGLGLYLGTARRFDLRKFSQGFLAGLLAINLVILGWMILPFQFHPRVGSFYSCLVRSLPVFLGLLPALWIAGPRPNAEKSIKRTA